MLYASILILKRLNEIPILIKGILSEIYASQNEGHLGAFLKNSRFWMDDSDRPVFFFINK